MMYCATSVKVGSRLTVHGAAFTTVSLHVVIIMKKLISYDTDGSVFDGPAVALHHLSVVCRH